MNSSNNNSNSHRNKTIPRTGDPLLEVLTARPEAPTECRRRDSWADHPQDSCRHRATHPRGLWVPDKGDPHQDFPLRLGGCPHHNSRCASGLSTLRRTAKAITTTGWSLLKVTFCEDSCKVISFSCFSRTTESVWEKPKELTEFENRMQGGGAAPGPVQAPAKASVAENGADSVKAAVEEAKKQAEIHKPKPAATPSQPQDKTRPVSSTPVPGTPWCVVWTGDNR